jgi:hypothetical protein
MNESIDLELTPRQREVLLVEYQAAQASAQHHDQLLWTVTGIAWATNLALMGFIAQSSAGGWSDAVYLGLCLLGAVLIVFAWSSQSQFRALKNQGYDRCRAIERRLGMDHHLSTKYDPGSQTHAFGLISAFFVVLWLLIALSEMVQRGRIAG